MEYLVRKEASANDVLLIAAFLASKSFEGEGNRGSNVKHEDHAMSYDFVSYRTSRKYRQFVSKKLAPLNQKDCSFYHHILPINWHRNRKINDADSQNLVTLVSLFRAVSLCDN